VDTKKMNGLESMRKSERDIEIEPEQEREGGGK